MVIILQFPEIRKFMEDFHQCNNNNDDDDDDDEKHVQIIHGEKNIINNS